MSLLGCVGLLQLFFASRASSNGANGRPPLRFPLLALAIDVCLLLCALLICALELEVHRPCSK